MDSGKSSAQGDCGGLGPVDVTGFGVAAEGKGEDFGDCACAGGEHKEAIDAEGDAG